MGLKRLRSVGLETFPTEAKVNEVPIVWRIGRSFQDWTKRRAFDDYPQRKESPIKALFALRRCG